MFLWGITGTQAVWQHDFQHAKTQAESEHNLILLNISGSDWCLPCIRMKQDVFESPVFVQFASNLVLVNADFPRKNKNRLPEELVTQNEKLAEQYNPEGLFPLTLLLDAQGKVIHRWAGEPLTADVFVSEVKHACGTSK